MGLISRVSSRTYRNLNKKLNIMGRSRSRSPAYRNRSRSPPRRDSRGGDRDGGRGGDRGDAPKRYNSADLHSVRIGGRDSLPRDVTKEEVQSLFEKFGEIGDIYLPRDRDNRGSYGGDRRGGDDRRGGGGYGGGRDERRGGGYGDDRRGGGRDSYRRH